MLSQLEVDFTKHNDFRSSHLHRLLGRGNTDFPHVGISGLRRLRHRGSATHSHAGFDREGVQELVLQGDRRVADRSGELGPHVHRGDRSRILVSVELLQEIRHHVVAAVPRRVLRALANG
jgi:hypothetical protein